jgi:DNA-binding transcriptional LysR family regulator
MHHVRLGHYPGCDGTVVSMDLRRLTYFVTVAEEQHFGRAATRLHMTAPPLSQRIRELEAELGVQLFERSTRQVHLTPAGSRLLHEARSSLRAIDRFTSLAESLRRAAGSANEPLTLAYCHGSEYVALEAAAVFHGRHPQTSVRPSALTSLRIFKDLRDGRVTVAIARSPVLYPDRLHSQLLARVPFDHVAVPSGHPLAERDVVDVAQLDGQPVLLVERDDAPTYHDSTLAYCASHDVRPAWVIHPASQVERMLDMVAVGSGIGWLNAWQAAHVTREGVAIRPLQPVERFDEFHLVWRVDDDSKSVEQFVEIAMEAGSR